MRSEKKLLFYCKIVLFLLWRVKNTGESVFWTCRSHFDSWCHITFAYSQRREKCLELTDNKIKDLLLYLLLVRKFYFKELKCLVMLVAFLLEEIYSTSPVSLIHCLFDKIIWFTNLLVFSYFHTAELVF